MNGMPKMSYSGHNYNVVSLVIYHGLIFLNYYCQKVLDMHAICFTKCK